MYLPGSAAGALTPFGDLFNYRAPPAPFTPGLRFGAAWEGGRGGETGGGGGASGATGAAAASQQQQEGLREGEQQVGAGGDEAAAGFGSEPQQVKTGSPPPQAAAAAAAAEEAAAVLNPLQETEQTDAALQHLQLDNHHEGSSSSSSSSRSSSKDEPWGVDEGDEGAAVGGATAGDGAFDEGEGMYKLYARTEYRPGEQVFLCYGRHTNLELLETYGFCLPPGGGPSDNPHDAAPLPPGAFAPYCRREPPLPAADCRLHWNGLPSWELLRVLRVNAATPGEQRARGHLALEGWPVAAEGDEAPARWLRAVCSEQLEGLSTSIEEDETELERLREEAGAAAGDTGHRDECLQLAGAWRLGLKRMLRRGSSLRARELEYE